MVNSRFRCLTLAKTKKKAWCIQVSSGTAPRIVLIGYGPVASYKYSRFIIDGIKTGRIQSYSLVDLKSRQREIEAGLLSAEIAPEESLYLDDSEAQNRKDSPPATFARWLSEYRQRRSDRVGVFIATEPQAHESYLRHCITSGMDTITAKPIAIPMRNNRYDIGQLLRKTEEIARLAKDHGGNHAVLCLGRHHDIYDSMMRSEILTAMEETGAPVTSAHLKTASGVWNLPREFETREDHPYKFGYGMLMHGAYHYVDLLARFILMNRRIYPREQFRLSVSAYSASPSDQKYRIPPGISRRLSGFEPGFLAVEAPERFGETDVVGTYRLSMPPLAEALAIGTFGLEQTTPGMRSWAPFPEVPYNINGRLHATDIDIRLATVFSASARVLKVPIGARESAADLRARNIGRYSYRANAALLGRQEFFTEGEVRRPHGLSFSYTAEKKIFDLWVSGRETYSSIESHLASAALLQSIGESARTGGEEISIPYDYPEPEWPEVP